MSRAAGVTQEQLLELADYETSAAFTDEQRLVLRLADAMSMTPATISDELFRARCIVVKEERAELTKHHIDVMWHDYFKPEHVEKFPDLHETCWKAAKQASLVKRSLDIAEAQKLLDLIDKIDHMWRETGGPAATRMPAAAAA